MKSIIFASPATEELIGVSMQTVSMPRTAANQLQTNFRWKNLQLKAVISLAKIFQRFSKLECRRRPEINEAPTETSTAAAAAAAPTSVQSYTEYPGTF